MQQVQKVSADGVIVGTMQTRNDLYDYLGYHAYEQKLDSLFAKEKSK